MEPAAEGESERRHRALVVDDSPIIRTVLRHILTDYEVGCDEVGTGGDALRLFESGLEKQQPYDLVCLDVHLPDLSGVAVLSRMRRMERTAPGRSRAHIVVLSADDSERTVSSTVSDGADAYFLKPFDRNSLISHLDKLFRCAR